MRALSRFLLNPFEDPSISLGRLLAFATDHLQLLILRNGDGRFDARVAATQAALAGLQSGSGSDGVKLGQRKASKKAKGRFRKELRQHTRRIEGALIAAFGPRSGPVRQAFPLGRRIFNRCPDDLLRNHLKTMNDAVTAHAGALPVGIVDLSAQVVAEWAGIYTQSESSSGAKSASEARLRAARSLLERELFITLATLIALHPGEPEKLSLYM